MPAIDEATMRKLMQAIGGEPDVMRELVDTFLDEGPRIAASMQEALAKDDQRTLNRCAHSLKSTAATFGAGELARLCRDLERTTEKDLPPETPARVDEIVEEWARVRADLAAWTP